MSEEHNVPSSLVLHDDDPLIGIVFEEDGREVVRYFASEEEAERALSEDSTSDAISLIGAWKDLDWDEMEKALDRIRHESPPSPPLSL
jgi:hypothetical protein